MRIAALRTANKLWLSFMVVKLKAPVAAELDHDKVWNMANKAEFYSEVLVHRC